MKGFNLNPKARIWPWLFYMCHILSTAVGGCLQLLPSYTLNPTPQALRRCAAAGCEGVYISLSHSGLQKVFLE